jgi:hypothetical protein
MPAGTKLQAIGLALQASGSAENTAMTADGRPALRRRISSTLCPPRAKCLSRRPSHKAGSVLSAGDRSANSLAGRVQAWCGDQLASAPLPAARAGPQAAGSCAQRQRGQALQGRTRPKQARRTSGRA